MGEMTERENFLAAANFRGPEWIPCSVGIMPGTWARYREDLEDLAARHPSLFPDFERGKIEFDSFGPTYRENELYTDNWGTVWDNRRGGMEGSPVRHPIADWSALSGYEPPDPLRYTEREQRPDWAVAEAEVKRQRAQGRAVWGYVDRLFERLHFLRGFENLMHDLGVRDPRVHQLVDIVVAHNLTLGRKWVQLGVDVLSFGDDLGWQTSPMVGVPLFEEFLLPGYSRQFAPAVAAGIEVYLHSDGCILDLVPDLVKAGVTIINPQVGCNGLPDLVRVCKGKVCVNLDLDRQGVFPFGSPKDVRDHVREAIDKLGSPAGGLMLYGECEPDVPLENIEALCLAMEELALGQGA
jgi:uroporphyrinogen decarboxylase